MKEPLRLPKLQALPSASCLVPHACCRRIRTFVPLLWSSWRLFLWPFRVSGGERPHFTARAGGGQIDLAFIIVRPTLLRSRGCGTGIMSPMQETPPEAITGCRPVAAISGACLSGPARSHADDIGVYDGRQRKVFGPGGDFGDGQGRALRPAVDGHGGVQAQHHLARQPPAARPANHGQLLTAAEPTITRATPGTPTRRPHRLVVADAAAQRRSATPQTAAMAAALVRRPVRAASQAHHVNPATTGGRKLPCHRRRVAGVLRRPVVRPLRQPHHLAGEEVNRWNYVHNDRHQALGKTTTA